MQHTTYEYRTISKENLAKGYRTIKGNWVNVPLLKDGIYEDIQSNVKIKLKKSV
jgi:hypothetical protein